MFACKNFHYKKTWFNLTHNDLSRVYFPLKSQNINLLRKQHKPDNVIGLKLKIEMLHVPKLYASNIFCFFFCLFCNLFYSQSQLFANRYFFKNEPSPVDTIVAFYF